MPLGVGKFITRQNSCSLSRSFSLIVTLSHSQSRLIIKYGFTLLFGFRIYNSIAMQKILKSPRLQLSRSFARILLSSSSWLLTRLIFHHVLITLFRKISLKETAWQEIKARPEKNRTSHP